MNDLLFSVPETGPTALQSARARLAIAQDAYDKASELEDETGEPMMGSFRSDLQKAKRDVARAEVEEVRRLCIAHKSPGPHVEESDQ